ncbi:MAG: LemA family protein [Bacteroidota bacterium]
MSKSIIYLVLVVLGLFFVLGGCSSYNSLVDKDENVEQAWGNVQNAYQRRADLIPQLVATVKGAAEFEKSTITAVTEARAKATSITIDPSNITPEQLQQFQQAQSGLTSSLSRLLATFERYPELKATDGFRQLQAQLEGTENRIKVERDKFNSVVTTYNKSVRKFPAAIFAGIFGFDRRPQFESDSGAEDAPEVNFDFSK